ncbi:hypothetical protein HYPSUDRAFT_145461, partial [Hypholoma sublateritium FD-334 SS-4]
QYTRAYDQLLQTTDRQNTILQSLKNQNWTLYYALPARHLRALVHFISLTEVSTVSS